MSTPYFKKNSKYYRIIAIDGGGMRGIVSAYVLAHLEKKIQHKTNNPQARLIDYVDMVAGTSTGAIIGALLLCPDTSGNKPLYDAQQIPDIYARYGKTIFRSSFWQTLKSMFGILEARFNDNGLAKTFTRYFGDTPLSRLLKPCLMTAYSMSERRTFVFRRNAAQEHEHEDFLVRDMLRGCVAAPALFPVAEVRAVSRHLHHLIDGAVFAYNPTLCAYSETRQRYPEIRADDIAILSLSGGVNDSYPMPKKTDNNWGTLEWTTIFQHVVFGAQAESCHQAMQQIFLTCPATNQYLRLVPDKGIHTFPTDTTQRKALATLLNHAQNIVLNNNKNIDSFIDLLLEQTHLKKPWS